MQNIERDGDNMLVQRWALKVCKSLEEEEEDFFLVFLVYLDLKLEGMKKYEKSLDEFLCQIFTQVRTFE